MKKYVSLLILPFSLLLGCAGCDPVEMTLTTDLGTDTYRSKITSQEFSAYRVSPGATVFVTGFPDLMQEITSVRLGVYNDFLRDPPMNDLDEFGNPVFIPMRLDPNSFSSDSGSFSAVLDPPVTNLLPGFAFLEVEYLDFSGNAQTESLGALSNAERPPLYFVPAYVVHLGVIDVEIGSNVAGHSVDASIEPVPFGIVYEDHFAVSEVRLQQPSDFGGQSWLRDPCAQQQLPKQGYHVTMDPLRSGTLRMEYRIVGPAGRHQTEYGAFDSFGELGAYAGAVSGAFPSFAGPAYSDSLPSTTPPGLPFRCE